ncbi:hypothetical protein CQA66_01775 [Helicobacter aurati]|uniref:Uncharacterized protein n=1 Tax=Helicobacter aurati TaxID=137778 RepID=A0A3D8J8B2_9HELI|nr:hypothetical protein [Helicobacter aurati]RDU73415.1 hypothetical protein CQA66_01775 [Helicobacter aurati]
MSISITRLFGIQESYDYNIPKLNEQSEIEEIKIIYSSNTESLEFYKRIAYLHRRVWDIFGIIGLRIFAFCLF